MNALSRRSLIVGFATGVAVGVTPAVLANPVEFEGPAERVNRLAEELSDALEHWCQGQFRAVVEPGADGNVWFQNMKCGPRGGHV